jgi:hypothetical protein
MNPEIITISFVPDGTNLGGYTSNLQSKFNNTPSLEGKWQNIILQAAQTWAQKTNINFTVVPDDGAPTGSGADQEGDPGFGDIRIGGYNFGNSSTLAWTSYPPSVNDFSIAGDVNFNTALTFNNGSTYDLFTVAAHEIGHALGLGESSTAASNIMYPTYNGVKIGLAPDDIAGIQSIYSSGQPRSDDAYLGNNSSVATAANLDNQINSSTLTALAYNLDIANAGQSEFFSVDAPSGTNGTFDVTAQSLGLSLLDPKITVYASDGVTVLGTSTGTGDYGSDVSVALSGVTAGETFYIKVQGANTTAFGTGDYALGMSFNSAGSTSAGTTTASATSTAATTAPTTSSVATPTEASPIIAYPNGTPLHSGGGSPNQILPSNDVPAGAAPTVMGISSDSGYSPSDGIINVNRILINGIGADDETVNVYINGNLVGTTTTDDQGNWTFDNTNTALADGTYTVTAASIGPDGTLSSLSYPYGVTIDTTPPPAPTITGIVGSTVLGGFDTTNTNPILFGTAQPYSQVTIFEGSNAVGTATVNSLGDWNWYVQDALTVGTQYSFTAQATDLAGNSGDLSAATNVLVVAPTWGVIAPTVSSASIAIESILGVNLDGSFDTTDTPTITGLATATSEVVVFNDGIIIGQAVVDFTGAWSFTTPTLSTGRQQLTFAAMDAYGNLGAMTLPITIQV